MGTVGDSRRNKALIKLKINNALEKPNYTFQFETYTESLRNKDRESEFDVGGVENIEGSLML